MPKDGDMLSLKSKRPKRHSFLQRAIQGGFTLCLFLCPLTGDASAETSSWTAQTNSPTAPAINSKTAAPKQRKRVTEKPSTKTARPDKPRPALRGSTAPNLGEQAYFAFDQGRYLTAVKLAKQAAARKDPQSHTLLGRIYADGLGVPKNEIVAAEWFYKGAALGDLHAAFAYGLMAARGRGVQKDMAIAAQFLDRAAKGGNVLAKYNLALVYVQTAKTEDDLKPAFQLMSAAARAGHIPAQYDLGVFYADGRGIAKDIKKAAVWIGKAADAGHADAQLDFARLNAKGLGVAKDGKKAFNYIRRAALQGNPVAQNRLARFYAYGVETEPDIIKATQWHLLARAAGVADGNLDQYISRNTAKERAAAEKLVEAWKAKTSAQ